MASLCRMLPLNELNLYILRTVTIELNLFCWPNCLGGGPFCCFLSFLGGGGGGECCKKQNSNWFQNRKNCCNIGNIILRQIIQRKQSF